MSICIDQQEHVFKLAWKRIEKPDKKNCVLPTAYILSSIGFKVDKSPVTFHTLLQDKVNRVLWLNSLPSRFKKEILKKLIEDKIELTVDQSYKIYVDFGPCQTKQKSQRNSPQKAQSMLTTAFNFSLQDTGARSPVSSEEQHSQSPIRVAIHQLAKSESRVRDSFTSKTLSRAEQLRLAQSIEYEKYLKTAMKPSEQSRIDSKKTKVVHMPSVQAQSSSHNQRASATATATAAAAAGNSKSSVGQDEKDKLRSLRLSQISRQRLEAQDSWKEFTQNITTQKENKDKANYQHDVVPRQQRQQIDNEDTIISMISGQALKVAGRNDLSTTLQQSSFTQKPRYDAVLTTDTLELIRNNTNNQTPKIGQVQQLKQPKLHQQQLQQSIELKRSSVIDSGVGGGRETELLEASGQQQPAELGKQVERENEAGAAAAAGEQEEEDEEDEDLVNIRLASDHRDAFRKEKEMQQAIEYSLLLSAKIALTPAPDLEKDGAQERISACVAPRLSESQVDYRQPPQRTSANISSNRWCLVPSATISNHLSENSHKHKATTLGLRSSIRKQMLRRQKRHKQMGGASELTTITSPVRGTTTSEEVSFNAETFAAKKKLLQQMIEELENEKQKIQQDRSQSGKRTISKKSDHKRQPNGITKLLKGGGRRQQRSNSKQETYRIRRVLISEAAHHHHHQHLQNDSQFNVAGSSGQNEARSLEIEGGCGPADTELDFWNDNSMAQRFMMMNTIDVQNKQKTLSRFKQLRKVTMPKAKTVQQYISDHMRSNASQLQSTLRQIKESKCQASVNQAASRGEQARAAQQRQNSPFELALSYENTILTAVRNQNNYEVDDGQVMELRANSQGTEPFLGADASGKQKNTSAQENSPSVDNNSMFDNIYQTMKIRPPQFRPNSQLVKGNSMRPGAGLASSDIRMKEDDNIQNNQKTKNNSNNSCNQTQNADLLYKNSLANSQVAVGIGAQKEQLSTEFIQGLTDQNSGSKVGRTMDDDTSTRKNHIVTNSINCNFSVANEESFAAVAQNEATRKDSNDIFSKRSSQMDQQQHQQRHQQLQKQRKHIVIPQMTTPRLQEHANPGGYGAVGTNLDEASASGNNILNSRLAKQIDTGNDDMSAADVGISAADFSLMLDQKRISQTKNSLGVAANPEKQQQQQQQQMLTINYFGNIHDHMIGQIKTKIPISDKQQTVKTFNSPPRQSFQCTEEAALAIVKPQTASTQNQNDLASNNFNQVDHQLVSREQGQANSNVFYANIGQEPYRINQYVRPKALATFKLVKNTSEKELDFERRKLLHRQERDIERQQEKLNSQHSALRGSMLKDHNVAHQDGNTSNIAAQTDQSRLEQTGSAIYPQEPSFTLKQSASQPHIRLAASSFIRNSFIPVTTDAYFYNNPATKDNTVNISNNNNNNLSCSSQGGLLAERGSRIMNQSRSRPEIESASQLLPQVANAAGRTYQQQQQQQQQEAAAAAASQDEIRRALTGISPYRKQVDYLQKEEKAFLDHQKETQYRQSNNGGTTAEYMRVIMQAPEIKTRPFKHQQQQRSERVTPTVSPPNDSLMAEFVKNEKIEHGGSPFNREARYAVEQINLDLEEPMEQFNYSPQQRTNIVVYENNQSSVGTEQSRTYDNSTSTLPNQASNIQCYNHPQTKGGEHAAQVIHSWTGATATKDREAIYSSLSTIEEGGSQILTNQTPKKQQLQKRPHRFERIQQKAQTAGSSSVRYHRQGGGQYGQRSSTGRNTVLSHSVKLGKLNASLAAHSHAEQIKSFVNLQQQRAHNHLNESGDAGKFKALQQKQQQQHTLLSRNLAKTLGNNTQQFAMVDKAHLAGGLLDSQQKETDEEDVLNFISQLTKPSISKMEQFKEKVRENRQEFKMHQDTRAKLLTTAGSRTIPQKAPTATELTSDQTAPKADQNSSQDADEIYLRFLRYKNQKFAENAQQ